MQARAHDGRPFLGILILSAIACGPFDRRDGALVVELEYLASEADTIEMTVRAGGRSFSERMSRPTDNRITAFSAVPAGPAELDLRVLAGERLLHERLGLALTILEGETLVVPLNFEDGPTFRIREPPDGVPHQLRGAPSILIEIKANNPELDIELSVFVGQKRIGVTETAGVWIGTLDPRLAGEVLPAPIELHVIACLADSPTVCVEADRSVEVTRHAWRQPLASGSSSRPGLSASQLVAGDADGNVAMYAIGDGALVRGPFAGSPVFEDIAAAGDLAAVVDDAGTLTLYDLEGVVATHPIGATTAPVAGASIVWVGANEDVIAVDGSGARTVLATPRRMRAPPLVDTLGIAAADIFGNVIAIDPTTATVLSENVGASIFAAPVRHAGQIVVGTSDDRIVLFETPPLTYDLGAPVIFAPVSLGEILVVAAGDRVHFIGTTSSTIRVDAPITGGPAKWSNDEVVVGLRNGWVVVVGPTAFRVMGKVLGAATSPLVIESLGSGRGRGVAVVGTAGDLTMLEPEDDF